MHDIPHDHNRQPTELDRQLEVLRCSIDAEYSYRPAYDELDPHDEWATRPTPLDPYGLRYLGDDFSDDTLTYSSTSTLVLEGRLNSASERIGLPENDYKKDPSHAYERADKEIIEALAGRVRRNGQSYERLLAAIEARDQPIDDAMFEIIEKARVGQADWPQLLRLIKEYPEMISVEAMKFTKPFCNESRLAAREVISEQAAHLRDVFNDAEVTLSEPWEELKEPYIDENGVRVRKYRVARIRSRDSDTELIVKETDLVVLPSLVLRHTDDLPADIGAINIQGTDYAFRFLPFGIGAYFRTVDYENRPGYDKPEQRLRAMGELALRDGHVQQDTLTPEQVIDKYKHRDVELDPGILGEDIDPKYRQAFVEAAAASLRGRHDDDSLRHQDQ